jgi:hypothetical protein
MKLKATVLRDCEGIITSVRIFSHDEARGESMLDFYVYRDDIEVLELHPDEHEDDIIIQRWRS